MIPSGWPEGWIDSVATTRPGSIKLRIKELELPLADMTRLPNTEAGRRAAWAIEDVERTERNPT